MAKGRSSPGESSSANLGFESRACGLWLAAINLRSNMDGAEYRAENIFWVPKDVRWGHLQARAKPPSIGKDIDDAMVATG